MHAREDVSTGQEDGEMSCSDSDLRSFYLKSGGPALLLEADGLLRAVEHFLCILLGFFFQFCHLVEYGDNQCM